MNNSPEWWCYPYIYIENNFIPIAVLILGMQCIVGILYILINNRMYDKGKRHARIQTELEKKLLWNLLLHCVIIFMIYAFIQTDSQYVLYQIFMVCAQNLRQIDGFIYTIIIVLFIWGMRFKNCHTCYNKLKDYIIYLNFVEIIIILFHQHEIGEKGYLNETVQLILVFLLIVVNCTLQDVKFGICDQTLKSKKGIKEDELFEERKAQMEEIYRKIVTYNGDQQMTIFISDEWGGGKTFFAKELTEKLKAKKEYNVIWINMSDFNERETFMKQVLRQILSTLQNNNYYTGNSSETEKYLETVLNITLNENVAGLVANHFKMDAQRDGKQNQSVTEMAEEFSNMLGNDKIVIVIDDMDRCTEETIAATVKFFSEIILLPKSIIVFAGDYKHLLNKKGFKDGFFDKYFMYNYNLNSIPYPVLIKYYQEKYSEKVSNEFEVSEEINRMFSSVKSWVENEEKYGIAEMPNLDAGVLRDYAIEESRAITDNLEIGIRELEKRLSNPRKVKRIYETVYDNVKNIEDIIEIKALEKESLKKELKETVYPGILFQSLVKTICTEKFWDIYVDDFSSFQDDIVNTIARINEKHDNIMGEEYIYMLLVYYFFSSMFNKDRQRIGKITRYYQSVDVSLYLQNMAEV